MNTCTVCGWPHLPRSPLLQDHLICPCCGTQFGYNDALRSHAELRRQWVDDGARWFSRIISAPEGWNALRQLLAAGYFDVLLACDVGSGRLRPPTYIARYVMQRSTVERVA